MMHISSTYASLAAAVVFACCAAEARAGQADRPHPNVHPRGRLTNSRIRFERGRKGHVAFIGGSITEMNGYRPMIAGFLQKRFPRAKFTFTNAGISSTCSTTGAFRLRRDVLAAGPVDLLLIEFAVNDDQDAGHARTECIRGMEGIVRQVRDHNPNADVIITYFVNPGMLKLLQGGTTPVPIAAHEAVAARYGVPTIHLAKEVAGKIKGGAYDWKQFGGTHPAAFGNRVCAGMIEALLESAWSAPLPNDAKPAPHPMPAKPLDPLSYVRGRLIDVKQAKPTSGWQVGVPPWKELKGSCRKRFAKVTMLAADRPGATLRLAFEGTAVGAYVLAGPDAGVLEATIDGGKRRTVDLYHRFSRGLHYPRTVMFDADLEPGKHTLTLRLTAEHNKAATGTAARILHFVAN